MKPVELETLRRDTNGVPRDQPLMARCGICGEWVMYAVEPYPRTGGKAPGVLLQLQSRRGGAWAMTETGMYRRNREKHDVWAADTHRCSRHAVMNQ